MGKWVLFETELCNLPIVVDHLGYLLDVFIFIAGFLLLEGALPICVRLY